MRGLWSLCVTYPFVLSILRERVVYLLNIAYGNSKCEDSLYESILWCYMNSFWASSKAVTDFTSNSTMFYCEGSKSLGGCKTSTSPFSLRTAESRRVMRKHMAQVDWPPTSQDHPFRLVADASNWISGCTGRVWVDPGKPTYTIDSPRSQPLSGLPDNPHAQ